MRDFGDIESDLRDIIESFNEGDVGVELPIYVNPNLIRGEGVAGEVEQYPRSVDEES